MEHPEERAAERSLRDMEQESEELGEHIEQTRTEWERKQRDPAVPGAESGGESEADR
jgi:hypothetical protein